MTRLTQHDEDLISLEVFLDDIANLMMHSRVVEVVLNKTDDETVKYSYTLDKERGTLQ